MDHVTHHGNHRVHRSWAGLILVTLLSGLALLPGASGQSVWNRLRSNQSKKKQLESKLRNIKAEQATRRNTLSSAQADARVAKSAYETARNKLGETPWL